MMRLCRRVLFPIIALLLHLSLCGDASLHAITPKDALQQMRPNTGIEEEPASPWVSWPKWALMTGATLLGVGVGAGMAVWLVKRRQPAALALQAHQVALKELKHIERLGLPAQGEVQRYVTELSSIVRRYLEMRFRLAATRQTTPEFLESMRSSTVLSPAQQQMLREFLEHCDLVKFAGHPPTPEECQNLAAAARRLVEQTAARPSA